MLAVNAAVPGYSGWNAFNIYPTAAPYAVPANFPKLPPGVPGQQEPEAFPSPLSVSMQVKHRSLRLKGFDKVGPIAVITKTCCDRQTTLTMNCLDFLLLSNVYHFG